MGTAAVNDLFRALDTRYGRLTIFANDIGAASQSLVKYGEWAENELSFLHAMIDEGATVLDVGAYVGTHALAFARFVGPLGHVVAIEPQIRTFEVLESNIEANAVGNVRLENAVASFETGEAVIPSIDIEQPESFGSASLRDVLSSGGGSTPAAPQPRRANDLAIRSITVDSLGISELALIKIDAEGMEDLVLRGARETILRSSPIIYAECNSLEDGLRSFEILKAAGYRVLAHVVSAYNPDNFRKDEHNLFGAAREVALLGVAGTDVDRVERYQIRPCEILLDIQTADDLALALLNKPQYGPEVLRSSAAAKSGGTLYLDETDATRIEADRLRNDVEALHRSCETERRDVEHLNSEIEALRRSIETGRCEVERLNNEFGTLRRSMETERHNADQEIAHARREAEAARNETERVREAFQDKADASLLQAGLARREADRLKAENNLVQRECDTQRARAAAAEATLTSVYGSHSPGHKAPVRAIFSLFHRAR